MFGLIDGDAVDRPAGEKLHRRLAARDKVAAPFGYDVPAGFGLKQPSLFRLTIVWNIARQSGELEKVTLLAMRSVTQFGSCADRRTVLELQEP